MEKDKRESLPELNFYPLTPGRWDDFEALFGPRGAVGGCWCMWWRIKRKEYEANRGEGNRAALKAIVESGPAPGLLAYDGEAPIGWVSVAPRADFGVLQRSPTLKPVDEQPVWSVVCFVVHKEYKGQGMSARLLQAAVDYAASQGAAMVEGYPIAPKSDDVPDIYSFTGFLSTFQAAGFVEVARRSEQRPIMRLCKARHIMAEPNVAIRFFWRIHPKLYRWSGGRIGRKIRGLPVLLLTTKGRKSGLERIKALMYLPRGTDFIVIASNLGQDRHPAWWLNLEAEPNAGVQVGSKRYEVLAREADGEEREEIWQELVARAPAYNEYRADTPRRIPVVVLERKGDSGRGGG